MSEYSPEYIYDTIGRIGSNLEAIAKQLEYLVNEVKELEKREGEVHQRVESLSNMVSGSRIQGDVSSVLKELAYIETTLLNYRDQLGRVRDQLSDALTQLNKIAGELSDIRLSLTEVVEDMKNLLANYQSRLEELTMLMSEYTIAINGKLSDMERELRALKESLLVKNIGGGGQ